MAAALVEQTYDALMQMIMDGNYKPGDRLPSRWFFATTCRSAAIHCVRR